MLNKIIEHKRAIFLIFREEEKMKKAYYQICGKGIGILDMYAPYPMDIMHRYEKHKSSVGKTAFLAGLISFILSFMFQLFVNKEIKILYANIPDVAFMPFIIVSTNIALLFAALAACIDFFLRTRLMPGQHNPVYDKNLSDDSFCLILDENDISDQLLESIDYDQLVKGIFRRQKKAFLIPLKITALIFITFLLSSCADQSGRERHTIPVEIISDKFALDLDASFETYPYTNSPEGYEKAGAELINPLMASRNNIYRGKELYQLYCKHCHGIHGDSDAPMVREDKYPPPPHFKNRLPHLSDGHIYHTLHFGKNLMPGNEKELNTEQKWQLLMYIKTLIGEKNKTQR